MYKDLAISMIESLSMSVASTENTDHISTLARTVKLNTLRNDIKNIDNDNVLSFLQAELNTLSGDALSAQCGTRAFAQFNVVQAVFEYVASF